MMLSVGRVNFCKEFNAKCCELVIAKVRKGDPWRTEK